MKLSALAALVGAFAVVIFTNHSEGDPVGALVNLEAAVIVLIGATVAALQQFHLKGIMRGVKGLKWLVRPPVHDTAAMIDQFCAWARLARREGLLQLERELEQIEDLFLRDGLQMVIDGVDVGNLRTMMRTRIETEEAKDGEPAELWEAIGGYAPTLGVLGAVMGLIHVMLHLSGNGANIGAGIAAAFVATLYGVGSANLIFLPMGKHLKQVVSDVSRQREMLMEGLVAIAEGANPQTLRMQLGVFLTRAAKAKEQGEPKAAEPAEETADAKA